MRLTTISQNAAACLVLKQLGAGRALVLSSALLAFGCASTADMQQLREAPGYQAGYVDGCETANETDKSFSTKRTRDAYAFDNDKAYRAGWRQGYMECTSTVPEANDGGRILGEGGEY